MRGVVSFHPVDLGFFDELIGGLVGGEKVNPEAFLDRARRVRSAEWRCRRYKVALERALEALAPPPPLEEGRLWDRVRSRLEKYDFRPDPLSRLVAERVEPDVHLHGRPFLITEGSAERVSALADEYAAADGEAALDALILEQLVRLDRDLGSGLEPADLPEPSPDARYRHELLDELRGVHDLARAARAGDAWGPAGAPRRPAAEILPRELPWRSVRLHARAVPFWIGRDVDGLEAVCRAAGVEPPPVLAPAWRPFARAIESFPALRDGLGTDLDGERSVGAFVAPDDVAELAGFLDAEGARIIRAASQHGEGPACAALLRKIRECARHAERHGFGYLEAGGIEPGPETDGADL